MSALFAAAETVFYCIILFPSPFLRCVLKCNVRCYRVKCHRSYEPPIFGWLFGSYFCNFHDN